MVADPRQGEIWWGDIPDSKPRPFLILTRDEAIPVLRRIVVAPVTRRVRSIATEVPLGPDDGLPAECAATFDNLLTVSKRSLVRRLGALGSARRDELCEALRALSDC